MSLFLCPICASPLSRLEHAYACPNRHSFDLSREGYVHLLPPNRMHSKAPGDDKEMALARRRFLSGGYYAHLREALGALALEHTGPTPTALDSGCGEGYYTAGVWEALRSGGRAAHMAGVDISKSACAGRQGEPTQWSLPWRRPMRCLWRTGARTCCSTASPPWPWTNSGGF